MLSPINQETSESYNLITDPSIHIEALRHLIVELTAQNGELQDRVNEQAQIIDSLQRIQKTTTKSFRALKQQHATTEQRLASIEDWIGALSYPTRDMGGSFLRNSSTARMTGFNQKNSEFNINIAMIKKSSDPSMKRRKIMETINLAKGKELKKKLAEGKLGLALFGKSRQNPITRSERVSVTRASKGLKKKNGMRSSLEGY